MIKQILDWKEIDFVFMDMDGTLLDLHFDNYFWSIHLPLQYSKHFSISKDDAFKFLREALAAEEGTLNWYSIDYWSKELGMDLAEMKSKISPRISIRPNARTFLSAVNHSGKKLIMVTNAHRKTFEIKMQKVDLSSWFHEIIISHDLEAAKENPLFWDRLNSLYKFDPHRTLLVDDNEDVLDVARNHGIKNLFTIAQPDSHKPPRINTRFASINDFSQIMPI